MYKNINKSATLLAASLVSVLALTGCSMFSKSTQPTPVATSNGSSIVFPDAKSASLKEGTFVDPAALRRLIPGMTKTQVYDLLGAPHFSEGVFGVHHWNYIFNFRTGKGSEYVTCQYQVKYDKDMRTESGNWNKRECADFIYPPAPVAPPPPPVVVAPPPPPPPPVRRVTLSADTLFAFNKSDLGSMSAAGRSKLDDLSRELRSVDVDSVHVIGYADRIGNAAANDRLSEQRASTVVRYLVTAGVPSKAVSSEGRGSREPVVECNQPNRAALIECLAPNRRVVIEIKGKAGS
jgi:outer membrane protein OmpA-like peptidoglycan-associated protein